MEKNEIKKLLYLNKPIAKLVYKDDTCYKYQSNVNDTEILFHVPIVDMGTNPGIFKDEMEAKLLIRWIV